MYFSGSWHSGRSGYSYPELVVLYRLISWCGQKCIGAMEILLRRFSRFQSETPAWAVAMADDAALIRNEFLRLYDTNLREFSRISPEQERITHGNSWKVLILKAYGRRLYANETLCPHTARLCNAVPGIATVLFSVLEPGTRLSPHRGPYAGVLRCHIPLIVPQGDCGIRVGTETYQWKSGRPLVFDDTVEHEAWNHTNQRRVILFIDFLRPLPIPLAFLNRCMIGLIGWSPFIGRMLRRSL